MKKIIFCLILFSFTCCSCDNERNTLKDQGYSNSIVESVQDSVEWKGYRGYDTPLFGGVVFLKNISGKEIVGMECENIFIGIKYAEKELIRYPLIGYGFPEHWANNEVCRIKVEYDNLKLAKRKALDEDFRLPIKGDFKYTTPEDVTIVVQGKTKYIGDNVRFICGVDILERWKKFAETKDIEL